MSRIGNKPSYDPILGVRGVAGTEENFGEGRGKGIFRSGL